MRRLTVSTAFVLAVLLANPGDAAPANIRFASPMALDRDAVATSIVVTDADHDGALDVIAAVADGVTIYYGDMRGGVRKSEHIPLPESPQTIALADMDRDGFLDLVITTGRGTFVAAGKMTGFAAPVRQSKPLETASAQTATAATADLNGDGVPDLVTIDGFSNALTVRFGQKDGGFGQQRVVTLPGFPRAIALGDFDGDGKTDLAMINGISEEIALLPGDGSGGFGDPIRIVTDGVPVAIATGDIDRNGRIDVVVALEKGIEVLPNVTIPERHPAAPGRRIQADSLQPRANDTCTTSFTFQTFDGTVGGYRWSDPSNWNPHLPGATDVACINYPITPALGNVVVTGPEAIAGELNANFPIDVGVQGAYDGGQLTLEDPPPTVSVINSLRMFQNGGITSLHQLQLHDATTFGGKISAVSPSPFQDAIRVFNHVQWEETTVNVSGGPLDFTSGASIAGALNLCNASTLVAQGVIALNGIINNCGDGGTPLVKLEGSLNADVSGNGGIFTDIQASQESITTTTTGFPGTFTINGGPRSMLSETNPNIAAGTSLVLANLRVDGMTCSGGTLILAGKVSGILNQIYSNLTLHGTLTHNPNDRAEFTNALGGLVTIEGSVDGHLLTIENTVTGGTLDFACIENGGMIDLQAPMSTGSLGAQIGNCGGTPGVFRVNYNGGSLLVQGQVDVDAQTDFEADGAINVTSGPLRIFGNPLGHRSAGHFSITDGTSVQIFGPYALDSIASFTGGGTLDNEGTLSPNGVSIPNLTTSGTINEPFTITQSMKWTGGTIYGSTNPVYHNGPTIQPGATLNVGSTFGAGTLNGAWLEIEGTANFTSLSLSNHSTVHIASGGVANGQSIYDTDFTGTLSEDFNASLNFAAPATLSLKSAELNAGIRVSGGKLDFYTQPDFGPYAILDTGGGKAVFDFGANFGPGFRSFDGGTVELTNHFYTGNALFNSNVQFDPGADIDAGHIQVLGSATVGGVTFGSGAETLTLNGGGAGGPISLNGGTLEIGAGFNLQGSINGNGLVHVLRNGPFGGPGGNLYGAGTISSPLQNDGSIGANGGSLFLQSVNNISGGTLTGGSWYANGGSTLGLPGVTTNTTSISANGPGARVSLGFPGLQTNAATGTLSLANGGTIDGGSFMNLGTISIGAGSTFNPQSFTQTGGQTLLNDPTAVLSAQSGLPALQAGLLQGSGIVQPGLQNGGATINVGFRDNNFNANPGTITVNGNYTETTPTALLHLFLVDETHYSTFHVTGSATLAGTIQLDINPYDDGVGDYYSFIPQPGDAFQVLTYGAHAGAFATILGQDLSSLIGPGYIFNPYYNPNNLTFIVEIPDPKVMIVNLENTINSFRLDAGTAQSLLSKLDAAHSALVRGDSKAACGQLGAALNFTNAQTGKKITADQAAMIVSAIQRIQKKVGCR